MGSYFSRRRRHAPQASHQKNRRGRAAEAVLLRALQETLLEETRTRAALELPRDRTLYVVNRAHEPYYKPILLDEPARNLVVQPSNRGTAPAILYSLLRIAAIDLQALVAFLPLA